MTFVIAFVIEGGRKGVTSEPEAVDMAHPRA
jgi:hypothetical protein